MGITLDLPPLKEVEESFKKKVNELADQKIEMVKKKHKENLEYLTKRLDEIAREFAKKISI